MVKVDHSFAGTIAKLYCLTQMAHQAAVSRQLIRRRRISSTYFEIKQELTQNNSCENFLQRFYGIILVCFMTSNVTC